MDMDESFIFIMDRMATTTRMKGSMALIFDFDDVDNGVLQLLCCCRSDLSVIIVDEFV